MDKMAPGNKVNLFWITHPTRLLGTLSKREGRPIYLKSSNKHIQHIFQIVLFLKEHDEEKYPSKANGIPIFCLQK